MHLCNISSIALTLTAAAAFAAPPELASPYQHYSIKLSQLYTPRTQSVGLILKARVDGGPALRLLLDSGAQHLVLDKRSATASGRASGAAIELVGIGTDSKAARRLAPATIEIGDLLLRDCEMLALDSKLIDGIDGVIPLSLFADFLVRLDVPGKSLDLDPYPLGPSKPDGTYSAARSNNNLLFLHARLNDSQPGYVLLDTGATYSAVSPITAGTWRNFPSVLHSVALRGGAGESRGTLLPNGIQFRLGAQVLYADPAVIVDLSDMSRHHRFEVAGVLGYSALRRAVVTVNYRDSLVRIQSK